jgi:hypothetical protein
MTVGVLGMLHGISPVQAKTLAPVAISASAPNTTALGAAAHVVVARAR